MILGLTELTGYIQILHPKSKSDMTFNSTLGLVYTIKRSLRGLMLWSIYVYGPVAKWFRKKLRGSTRKNNIPVKKRMEFHRKSDKSHNNEQKTCPNPTAFEMEMTNFYASTAFTNNNSKE